MSLQSTATMKMPTLARRRLFAAAFFLSVGALTAWLALGWTLQQDCDALQTSYLFHPLSAGIAGSCFGLLVLFCCKRRTRLQRALREARQTLEWRRKQVKDMEADMVSGAIIDRLTGAYSQRLFQEMAEKLMSAARHHRRPFSLVVIGPDYLQQIKERYGAAAADKVLVTVATTCRRTLRGEDIFARLDETSFVLAMPDTDAGAALIAGERFRKAISAQEVRTEIGNAVTVTVSIGVTQILGKEDAVRDMISRAEKALLTAMNGGRNQVMVS
jgi:diguanylate cyclase (GGDEF)-like protein